MASAFWRFTVAILVICIPGAVDDCRPFHVGRKDAQRMYGSGHAFDEAARFAVVAVGQHAYRAELLDHFQQPLTARFPALDESRELFMPGMLPQTLIRSSTFSFVILANLKLMLLISRQWFVFALPSHT